MKYHLNSLIVFLITTILCSSCMRLRSWERIFTDYISKADTLEIPIPSHEERTVLLNEEEIKNFVELIEIDEWKSTTTACFCRGNINLYFKQGTNELASVTVYHDGASLSWHNGLWPAYASLTKSSSEQLVSYFEALESKNDITKGKWKNSNDIPRPKIKLEPLTKERLDRINQCDMKK